MTGSYEYYKTYDDDAKGNVNLEEQIRDWLWNMDLMIEFIKSNRPEILDSFLKICETKYSNELKQTTFDLSEFGFDKIANDQSLLNQYTALKSLGLQVIMKYIPMREDYLLSEKKEPIRYLDYLRAKHLLLYHRISALVEILGRNPGIECYKEFVQFWGKELAKKEIDPVTITEARQSFVRFWKESGGFNFGVIDINDNAFLAKFDKCVWHESMKHVTDQELAYYTVCYPGPRLRRHADYNVWLRRSVTLFSGEFCDELRWDRHVHDEPEQPSHEFSRRIVPK